MSCVARCGGGTRTGGTDRLLGLDVKIAGVCSRGGEGFVEKS